VWVALRRPAQYPGVRRRRIVVVRAPAMYEPYRNVRFLRTCIIRRVTSREVSASDLRTHQAELLDEVLEEHVTLYVTRNGRRVAKLVPLDRGEREQRAAARR